MDSFDADGLTCVIPTYNRPHFLRRLLRYWSTFPLGGKVLIVDSSDQAAREKNEQLVEDFQGDLRLRYEHLDQQVFPKCLSALTLVDTPHVAFCADDDFLMPRAVSESLNFLRQNRDYACAQGMMVSVVSFRNNRCDMIRGFDITHDSPIKRFKRMAKYWYSTFYAVYSVPPLQECFRMAATGPKYDDARIYPELMMSQLTVLQGKVKFLPQVYNVRQDHELNDSRRMPRVQDLAHGEKHYQHFRELMAHELQRYGDITVNSAYSMIDANYEPLKQGKMIQNGLPKVRRELMRSIRKLVGRLRTDRVLERSRLSPKHAVWHDAAWRLAYRLILDYPEGMTQQELSAERRLASQRLSRAA